MGRPFLSSRRDLAIRWARAVQHVSGSVAVTLTVTWADEKENQIDGDSHTATAYGETSSGKPLGSLPGDLPQLVALAHLREVGNQGLNQARALEEHVAAKAKDNGQPQPPPDQIEEDTEAIMVEVDQEEPEPVPEVDLDESKDDAHD